MEIHILTELSISNYQRLATQRPETPETKNHEHSFLDPDVSSTCLDYWDLRISFNVLRLLRWEVSHISILETIPVGFRGCCPVGCLSIRSCFISPPNIHMTNTGLVPGRTGGYYARRARGHYEI